MKVKLIKQFKNLPRGTVADLSQRIYNHWLELGVIEKPKPKPVPLVFAPDLIKAAKDQGTKKVEKKKQSKKKEE